jgi:hypothetical protein
MRWRKLFPAGLAIPVLISWAAGPARGGAQDQSSSTQAASPSSSSAPGQAAGSAPMEHAEVQALLYKIYTANFRVGDLTGSLPIDQWKLSDSDRASLQQKAGELRDSTAKLEKARGDFYNHPDDSALSSATAAALQALPPQIYDFAKALENTPGSSNAKDYQQAASDLRDLDRQIQPYVAYLQAKNPTSAPAPSASAAPAPVEAQTAQAPAQAAQNPPAAASTPPEAPNQTAPAPAQAAQNPSAAASTPPEAPAQPAQAVAEAPAPAATTQAPAHPGVSPAAMQPSEVQALLYKIYTANFRVGDLTGSLGIDQWKLPDQDRATFSQKADALRTSAATVEKARNDFYNHPDDLAMGQAADTAIQSLLPKIDEFASALGGTPAANDAKDYQQAAGDLKSLQAQLEPYLAYLEAKNQPPPPPPPGPGGTPLETEEVKPGAAPPPLTVVAPEKSPVSNDQLKTLLYQAYVPAFRIKDLLGQEHPEHWQIPDAERATYSDASQALTKRLEDLANWRDQLDAHPESLEAAFEVYAALDKVAEPAGIVGHMVSQYGDPKEGSEYLEKARQVAEFRNQIEPYVGYLLRRHDEAVGAVERNFVTCETELTKVMRPTITVAEPMKNVLPVFRGRGKSVTRGGASSKAPAHSTRKKAGSKPASTKPAISGQ